MKMRAFIHRSRKTSSSKRDRTNRQLDVKSVLFKRFKLLKNFGGV